MTSLLKPSRKPPAPPAVNETQPTYDDDEAVIKAAKAIITRRMRRKTDCLTSAEVVRDFLIFHFEDKPAESFCCLFLDNQHRLIEIDEMFHGTIDGAAVYPREVVRAAIKHNAAAVMFAHNHPSAGIEPSSADKFITARLKQALGLLDIRVLDHFIVAGAQVNSFAELGLI